LKFPYFSLQTILIVSFCIPTYAQNPCLDASFGNNGISIHSFGTDTLFPKSIVLQQDGKILVVGEIKDTLDRDFILARYLNNGAVDSTFGTAGVTRIDFGNHTSDIAQKVILQSDGKIILGGNTKDSTFYKFALIRFNVNGVIDTTFGTAGKITLNIDTNNHFLQDICIQNDGKIVFIGCTINNGYLNPVFTPFTEPNNYIIRLNGNGFNDSTFGNLGYILLDFGNIYLFRKLALQPDQKILIAGPTNSSVAWQRILVARLDTSGTIDNSFSGIGYTTSFENPLNNLRDLVIQNNGKIIIQGTAGDNNNYGFYMQRFEINGVLDNSLMNLPFGTLSPNSWLDFDHRCKTIVYPNGQIANVSDSYNFDNPYDGDFSLLVQNGDGTINYMACDSGSIITNIIPGSTEEDKAVDAVLQNDNKIIQLGSSGFNTITLLRYSDFTLSNLADDFNSRPNQWLYPNPTQSNLIVEFSNELEIYSISVTDVSGCNITCNFINRNNQLLIETINLAKGFYIARIIDKKNNIFNVSFVKE